MAAPTLPDVFTVGEEEGGGNGQPPITLSTPQLQATFSSAGLLQSITSQGLTTPVSLQFVKYGVMWVHNEFIVFYSFSVILILISFPIVSIRCMHSVIHFVSQYNHISLISCHLPPETGMRQVERTCSCQTRRQYQCLQEGVVWWWWGGHYSPPSLHSSHTSSTPSHSATHQVQYNKPTPSKC